jgi:hypothetical protein
MVWLIPGAEGTQFHIVTGGTALFALLSYAQVMREIQNAA